MKNELQLIHEWARLIGADPAGGRNELQLLRSIARARGSGNTSAMNEVSALRAIAASYGKVGPYHELQALRAIVDGMGAKPSNRNLGDMNEIDCLLAIVRAGGGAAPAPSFSPESITGLKLWLKSDTLALNDDDPVTTWTDSSGLGNHAAQATEAAKPIYKTAIVNGKPVLRFDGADDFMACPAITAASGMTAFCVGKVTLATNFGMFFVVNSATFELRQNSTLGTAQLFAGTGTVNGGDATDAFHVYSASSNGANLSELWTDGASNGTRAEGPACGTPHIGARSGAVLPMNGDIAEVLLYDSLLSAANRQLIEAYLKAKYATP